MVSGKNAAFGNSPSQRSAQAAQAVRDIYQTYLFMFAACSLMLVAAYFSPLGQSLLSGTGVAIIVAAIGLASVLAFRRLMLAHEENVRQLTQLDRALLKNEATSQLLTEMLPVGIVTLDAKGQCQFANARFVELWGTHPNTIAKLNWQDAVHPQDKEQVQRHWHTLTHHGVPFSVRFRVVRPNGDTSWIHAQAKPLSNLDDQSDLFLCACNDITSSKEAELKIEQMAFHDSLTGLPNRRLLLDRLKQAVANLDRKSSAGALLFLDLDNFKNLNDTRGHDKGDALLRQVSMRLKACVREGDTVARLGGDEFVAILENLHSDPQTAEAQAKVVAEKILKRMSEPYTLEGVEHASSSSVGITLFHRNLSDVDELMKRADMAMYQAKAAGKNTARFFDPEMQAVVDARMALEAELRNAIHSRQFELFFQPQVIAQGEIHGAEAFVRWRHPQRGLVSPASFIPLAEETGLIVPLGQWVLRTACEQLATWEKAERTGRLTLTVKISGQQFRQTTFVDELLQIIAETGARASHLKLELNESLLMANVEDIIAKTNTLAERGIGIALADLGTGYSSLSHLKRLSLEQLRIDQTFVRGLLTNANDAAVTKSIFALAQTMGLTVSAEGVETTEQLNALANQGCAVYQGYLFSQPLQAAAFERLLSQQTS